MRQFAYIIPLCIIILESIAKTIHIFTAFLFAKKFETDTPATQQVNPMDFTVRRLKPISDFIVVKEIFKKSFDQKKHPIRDLTYCWNYRSKDDTVGFFTEDDTMVGFMLVSYHTRSGDSMYIDYFAILPEYRGNGTGSMILMNLVRKVYANSGSLHLRPDSAALAEWYERMGFNRSARKYYVFHSYGTRSQLKKHKELGLVSPPLLTSELPAY